MKRLLLIVLLMAPPLFGAYKLDISTTHNESNTAAAPARQRLFVRYHSDTLLNYVKINAGLSAAFDTSIAVDSLGMFFIRTATITTEGDSLLSDTWVSSYYGTPSVAVASIGANVITATAIAADAIGESELATGSITSLEIATDAIGAAELASNSITSAEIADDAIDAGAIATGAIGAAEIGTDAITNAEIAAGAIVAGTEATGFSTFDPAASGVFLLPRGLDGDTSFTNAQTVIAAIKAKSDKLTFNANDSLVIDYSSLPTVSLTQADLDYIIQGVIDAGIQIDTAAFRANLVAKIAITPLIVGTNSDKTGYYLANNALAGAVIQAGALSVDKFAADFRHEIALRSDSGNAPTPVIDVDAIAAGSYAYFTEGNREDVFKGGAGAGPDTTVIVVLSESDSLPIVGASVSYYVGADKLATRTNASGEAEFGATAGDWSAIVEAKPRYTGIATIAAGTRDTIFMTSPALPDADSDSLTTVFGYLYGLDGDPIQGAIVTARNQGNNIRVGSTVVSQYEVRDTTDAAGHWSIPLYPTVTLGGANFKYTFSLTRGVTQSIISKRDITVPDTTSWQFTW